MDFSKGTIALIAVLSASLNASSAQPTSGRSNPLRITYETSAPAAEKEKEERNELIRLSANVYRIMKPPYSKGAIASHVASYIREAKKQDVIIRQNLVNFLNEAIEINSIDAVKEMLPLMARWVKENKIPLSEEPLALALSNLKEKPGKDSAAIYDFLKDHENIFAVKLAEVKLAEAANEERQHIIDLIKDGNLAELTKALAGYAHLKLDGDIFLMEAIYANRLPIVKAVIAAAGTDIIASSSKFEPLWHSEFQANESGLKGDAKKQAEDIYEYLKGEAFV